MYSTKPMDIDQNQVYKQIDNYRILKKQLGGGQFAQVHLAIDINNKEQYLAVKIIPLINQNVHQKDLI